MHVEIETGWTVNDLIAFKKQKILTVNHEYQRGLRWTNLQKQMFLDSIFREYPIPAFYFHEVKKDAGPISNTYFEIVDGQQRVEAIYNFSENEFELIDPNTSGARFPNFVKDNPCPWAGQRYEALEDDLKNKLRETQIIAYKLTTENENEIRDLFIRLQGGTPLTPQDKRDSWPGNFTEFVLRFGGKSGVAKWYGLPLFKELVQGNESRRRQLAAQTFMLFDSVSQQRTFCDIKSTNIDEFYHQNVGFDGGSSEAKRFERVCETLYQTLAGQRRKLVGHHLVHSVLLFASLMDEYAKGWEQRFAGALFEFESRCKEASAATKTQGDSEFIRYWPAYAQWTQTQADRGATIQRRHAFFAAEMLQMLKPKRLDETRVFSGFEREMIFFRDGQRCQWCAMLGDEHPVLWPDSEVHHIVPFSEGGPTVPDNGALVHRDCHPKSRSDVAEFREWWHGRTTETAGGFSKRKVNSRALPPEGTEVKFDYKGTTYVGVVEGGEVHVNGVRGSHKTFSAASIAIAGTSRNGWRDWWVRLPEHDEWLLADDWRKITTSDAASP